MPVSFTVAAPKIKAQLWKDDTIEGVLFNPDDELARELVRVLTVPIPRVQSSARNLENGMKKMVVNTDQGPKTPEKCKLEFSGLPPELHHLVFNLLEDFHDVVHLGVTSHYFWIVAQRHIDAYHMSFSGGWAGQNIIAAESYTSPRDYPAQVFTEQEREEFARVAYYTSKYLDEGDRWEISLEPSKDMLRITEYNNKDMLRWFTTLNRAYNIDLRRYHDPKKPWILRNLTTKQFVRSEKIALQPEFIDGPDVRVLGLGHIVLSRICWHKSPDIGLVNYTGNIGKGVWAGHCFDITTMDRHFQKEKEEEWEDISNEIAKEMAEIWGSRFGYDWHREAIKRFSLYEEQMEGLLRVPSSSIGEQYDKICEFWENN